MYQYTVRTWQVEENMVFLLLSVTPWSHVFIILYCLKVRGRICLQPADGHGFLRLNSVNFRMELYFTITHL